MRACLCADDFHLTACMSLLKLVVEMTDGRSATRVQRESTAPLISQPTVAVPLLHVDDSLAESSAADADDADSEAGGDVVEAEGDCCFEDDIDTDYAADTAHDYLPTYKTDIEKGE